MGNENVLAANIKRGWRALGYKSLRSFALEAGVNYDTLRSLVRGMVQSGRADTLDPIAKLLGTTSERLRNSQIEFGEPTMNSVPGDAFDVPDPDLEGMGVRIKFIREYRLSQIEAVAKLLRCAPEDWLAVEQGKKSVDIGMLFAFMARFDVPMEFIIYNQEEKLTDRLRKAWQERA